MAEAGFYLNFADEGGWRGACIVRADPDVHPMLPSAPVPTSHLRGCNPGGACMVVELPEDVSVKIPAEYWHVALSKDDLEAVGEIIEPGGGELVEGTPEELRDAFKDADA